MRRRIRRRLPWVVAMTFFAMACGGAEPSSPDPVAGDAAVETGPVDARPDLDGSHDTGARDATLDAMQEGGVDAAALDAEVEDAGVEEDAGADGGPMCRSSGPCISDDECCAFCHDYDHCH